MTPDERADLLHRLDLMMVSPPHQLTPPQFRTVKQAYSEIEKLASMKRDLEKLMDIDNTDYGVSWFISRARWHLEK